MKIELPPLPPAPAMSLDQFHEGERAVSVLACQNYAKLYAAEVAALVREECAKLAESFATCPCNGQHGRCMENDPPLSIAAAIREQK